MDSQLNVVEGLMTELEEALERGLPLLGTFSIVKRETVINILEEIYGNLPGALQEAKSLLKRRDELQYEAQQRAEKIIADAQAEANRLLSESDLLRAVQREAEKIKEQVISECEEIQRKAYSEAESVRTQAIDDANRTKEGASVYAEQVLTSIEQNLNQLQEVVKNGQVQLERRRMESQNPVTNTPAPTNEPEYAAYQMN